MVCMGCIPPDYRSYVASGATTLQYIPIFKVPLIFPLSLMTLYCAENTVYYYREKFQECHGNTFLYLHASGRDVKGHVTSPQSRCFVLGQRNFYS